MKLFSGLKSSYWLSFGFFGGSNKLGFFVLPNHREVYVYTHDRMLDMSLEGTW